jgi:hypothetical protein
MVGKGNEPPKIEDASDALLLTALLVRFSNTQRRGGSAADSNRYTSIVNPGPTSPKMMFKVGVMD